MLFNTAEYLIFFLIALIVSWLLRNRLPLRTLALVLFSYYFYVSNNSLLILLLAASTLIDFQAARVIAGSRDPRLRRACLWCSLSANLLILGFFKYFNFFAHSLVGALNLFGIQLNWLDMNILLPVGISFYTFQSMSYTIDVYRGTIPAERSLLHFACYISYFPQLIAGPIVRADEFLPQTHVKPRLDIEGLERSLFRIASGLVKKIVFADSLAIYADAFFNAPGQADSIGAWVGVYAFCFQIYFDFSGYTDIAIGCAGLMGFHLPENFNAPYASASFSDFWRRWHMTLSRWFRDYVYIPLGGNRRHVLLNLLLTLSLCGLWHGAAWTFVFWGMLHGLLLCLERLLGWNAIRQPSLLRRLCVFQAITLSWIPFRARYITDMGDILSALFTAPTGRVEITLGMAVATVLMLGALLHQITGSHDRPFAWFMRMPLALRGVGYALVWSAIMVFNAAGAEQFIYFRF